MMASCCSLVVDWVQRCCCAGLPESDRRKIRYAVDAALSYDPFELDAALEEEVLEALSVCLGVQFAVSFRVNVAQAYEWQLRRSPESRMDKGGKR